MTNEILTKAIELNSKSNDLQGVINDLNSLPIIMQVGNNKQMRFDPTSTDEVELNVYNMIANTIKEYKKTVDEAFEAL